VHPHIADDIGHSTWLPPTLGAAIRRTQQKCQSSAGHVDKGCARLPIILGVNVEEIGTGWNSGMGHWNGALHTGHGTLEGLKSKPCRWGVNNIVRVTASGHDCCRRSGRCCGHWWCGCVFSSIELAEAAQWTPQFGYQVCILNKSVRLPKFIRWWWDNNWRTY